MNSKHVLFIFLIFTSITIFGQVNDYNWVSKGEIPKCIEENLTHFPSITIYPISHYSNEIKSLKNPAFSRIISSGRVLFGDAYCNKLNQVTNTLITKNCLKPESQIFVLKSSLAAIIAFDDIYLVSSGLLAQCTNEEQLYYLLIREKTKMDEANGNPTVSFQSKKTIDDLIEDFYACPETYEMKIDELALKSYLGAGFSPFQAIRALDVLRFSTQPFEEVEITNNYFGNSMYVPASFYDVADLKGAVNTANQYGQESLRLNFEKRKNKLLSLTSNPTANNTSGSKLFLELRTISRLQTIEEYLLKTDFETALYSIAIMEKEIPSAKNYLQTMKAHAWYGLVAQSYLYDVNRYEKKLIKNNQSESDRFFRLINRLNSFGIAAMALRYTTDVIAENKEIADELEVVRDEIVKILAQSQRFPLERFSKKGLVQNDKKEPNNAETKYDKIDLSKTQEAVSVDSNEFYFFGIPDLMSNEAFVAKFKTTSLNSTLINPSILVNFSSFNKKGINRVKSNSNFEKLRLRNDYIGAKSKQSTKIDNPFANLKTDTYNSTSELNQMILQKQYVGALSWGLLPLSHYRIDNTFKSTNENQIYFQFTHKYKPRIRSIHTLALTVVAIPWVVSDIFLRGNNSNYLTFTYNDKLKKIENFEQTELSHAWNKESASSQIINQILILNQDEK